MVKGVPIRVDKIVFTTCFSIVFWNLYILQLALSVGIGGLLFGYDIGIIFGALLYIKEEFEEVNQKMIFRETIVPMVVAGAIIGGWLNEFLGQKSTMMIVDALFFTGVIVMATTLTPDVIIFIRILIGLGVGMASVTSSLCISETSPRKIRGELGSTNDFFSSHSV